MSPQGTEQPCSGPASPGGVPRDPHSGLGAFQLKGWVWETARVMRINLSQAISAGAAGAQSCQPGLQPNQGDFPHQHIPLVPVLALGLRAGMPGRRAGLPDSSQGSWFGLCFEHCMNPKWSQPELQPQRSVGMLCKHSQQSLPLLRVEGIKVCLTQSFHCPEGVPGVEALSCPQQPPPPLTAALLPKPRAAPL